MSKKCIVMKEEDNVATALEDVEKDEEVLVTIGNEEKKIRVNEDIDFGHKFAINDIKSGEEVTKYGESIGEASEDIIKGDYVHVHNVNSKRGRGDLTKEGGE